MDNEQLNVDNNYPSTNGYVGQIVFFIFFKFNEKILEKYC